MKIVLWYREFVIYGFSELKSLSFAIKLGLKKKYLNWSFLVIGYGMHGRGSISLKAEIYCRRHVQTGPHM
jgi:hypothetical protein